MDALRSFCKKLPGVTENVKWGDDLCFLVANKIFCMTGFNPPLSLCVKVPDDEFDELSSREGFIPAPYLARYKWVVIKDATRLSKKEIEHYVVQSYELKKSKLSKKDLKKYRLI